MCVGGAPQTLGYNPKTGKRKNNKHLGPIAKSLEARQKASDIEKYGIPRTSLFEDNKSYYDRVRKENEKKVAEQKRKNEALIAQQQAQSQALQRQMAEQQQDQSKKVAGLQSLQSERLGGLRTKQAEKLSGIKSRGQSVVSSLQILGQKQPMAPTASQSVKPSGKRGTGSTTTNVSRGSARSRGTNLSI